MRRALRLMTALVIAALVCANSGCPQSPQDPQGPQSPKETHSFDTGTAPPITSLAFSADGKYLLAGTKGIAKKDFLFWQGRVTGWDLATRKPAFSVDVSDWVLSLALSPKNDLLAVGTGCGFRDAEGFAYHKKPGEVIVFEFPSLKEKFRNAEDDGVSCVRFSPDGTKLASSIFPRHQIGRYHVKIWDVDSWKLRQNLEGIERPAGVRFSPDGKNLAVADATGALGGNLLVKYFDPDSGKKITEFPSEKGFHESMEYVCEGKFLAVLFGHGSIELRDPKTGKDLASRDLNKAFIGVQFVASTADPKLLIGTTNIGGPGRGEFSSKTTLVVWDVEADKLKNRWECSGSELYPQAFALSPDGKVVAIGTNRGEVKLFKIAD